MYVYTERLRREICHAEGKSHTQWCALWACPRPSVPFTRPAVSGDVGRGSADPRGVTADSRVILKINEFQAYHTSMTIMTTLAIYS